MKHRYTGISVKALIVLKFADLHVQPALLWRSARHCGGASPHPLSWQGGIGQVAGRPRHFQSVELISETRGGQ